MAQWDRRRFLGGAGILAGSGLIGWTPFGRAGVWAQAPVTGIPEEILNPVEVSGAEAEPVMGKLPGQKHMYVLAERGRRVPPHRQPGDEADRAPGKHR